MSSEQITFTQTDEFVPSNSSPKTERAPRPAKADKTATKASKVSPPASAAKKLCEPLTDFYFMLSMSIAPFDSDMSLVIQDNAERMAESWVGVAETNPAFRRFLQRMTQTSAWGPVLMAHAPLATLAVQRIQKARQTSTDDLTKDAADSYPGFPYSVPPQR